MCSARGRGVLLGRDGEVREAGGFLLEVLPQCSEATLDQLEQALSEMPTISEMLDEGLGVDGITDRLMAGFPYRSTGEGGLRERMLRAVTLLGEEDAYQVIEEQGQLEVRCDFCAEKLQFGRDEVAS